MPGAAKPTDTETPPLRAPMPTNALRPGTRVNEFEITGVVGEGGFSIVYLAFDHSLHRVVALKEYIPSGLATRNEEGSISVRADDQRPTFDAGLRSFVNEARLLAQFDHPALLKVYRFWEGNGTAYMAMPYYEGRTLKQLLKEEPHLVNETNMKTVLAPVLDALELLHAHSCYHRDVSPDNILILENGAPVLLDFGAARRIIGETQGVTVILKPGYAPIEQYADDDMRQGPWTDIYAISAVLYAVITGKTPPTSVARVVKDPLVPLSQRDIEGFSKSFLAGIDRGLAVRPENRPQSIAEYREALGMRRPEGVDLSAAATTTLSREKSELRTRTRSGISAAPPTVGLEGTTRGMASHAGGHPTVTPPPARSGEAAEPRVTALPPDDEASLRTIAVPPAVTTRPGVAVPPSPRRPDRLPLWVIGGAGGVAIVAALVAWMAMSGGERTRVASVTPKAAPESTVPVPGRLSPGEGAAKDDGAATRVPPSDEKAAKRTPSGPDTETRPAIPVPETPLPPPVVTPPDDATAKTKPAAGAGATIAEDERVWESIKGTCSESPFIAFVFKFPSSAHVEEARERLRTLQEGGRCDWVKGSAPVGRTSPPAPAKSVAAGPSSTGKAAAPAASAPPGPAATGAPRDAAPREAAPAVKPPSPPSSAARDTPPAAAKGASSAASSTPATGVAPATTKPSAAPPTTAAAPTRPAAPAGTAPPAPPSPAGRSEQAYPSVAPAERVASAEKRGHGTLSLMIRPWGEIFVDGTSRGVSPPVKTLAIEEGRHTVEIRNPGFPSYTQVIEVRRDERVPITWRFN